MPLLADIQTLVGGRAYRSAAGDILVKAPIPCFLSLSFTIQLKQGQATPDTGEIKTQLARTVNRYGFTGRLPASLLSDVIHNHLEDVAAVSSVDMFGRIRRPDLTYKYIRDTETLIVPDEPENMLSGRTVAFLLDPNDIAVSVATVAIADV